MQAIRISYLGPTNSRGSRLKASFAGGSVTVPYPHHVRDCHKPMIAVKALVEKYKLDWGTDYVLSSHGHDWYATPAPGFVVSLNEV